MSLRDDIEAAARDDSLDAVGRTFAVTAILTEAMQPLGVVPVLVGGMAVLFWSSAAEFTTKDIDLVVDDPAAIDGVLGDLGFHPTKDRRHWSLPGTEVLVELPARELEPGGAETVSVEMDDGRHVDVISSVDLVIARAQELTVTPLSLPLRQVLALIPATDPERLLERAREVDRLEGVEGASVAELLQRLIPLADDLAAGRTELPPWDELYELVQGV